MKNNKTILFSFDLRTPFLVGSRLETNKIILCNVLRVACSKMQAMERERERETSMPKRNKYFVTLNNLANFSSVSLWNEAERLVREANEINNLLFFLFLSKQNQNNKITVLESNR